MVLKPQIQSPETKQKQISRSSSSRITFTQEEIDRFFSNLRNIFQHTAWPWDQISGEININLNKSNVSMPGGLVCWYFVDLWFRCSQFRMSKNTEQNWTTETWE